MEANNAVGDLRWFRQEHRTRGSRVHHLSASIAKLEHPDSPVEWDQTSEFTEITEYGLNFQQFCRDTGFEVIYSECAVYDDTLEIAGMLDLIGIMRKNGGIMALVDMKSGKVPPSVGPQTAAYKYMAERNLGIKIDKRFSLLLRGDKPYQLRELTDSRDWAVFQSMCNVYFWRRAHGLLEKEEE
jgi:hypothetical protein